MIKLQNQNGAIHLLLIGLCVFMLITGAGAWVLVRQHQDKRPLTVKESVTREDSKTTYTQLHADDIKQLENTPTAKPAETTPTQPKSHTSPQATPKQNTPSSTSSATPTPPTGGTITFSTDGCIVTGTGEPGWTFEVGAYTATKGGSVAYTIPSNGTLTKSSGGFKGMQAYGKFSNPQSINILMETMHISADQCPAAG